MTAMRGVIKRTGGSKMREWTKRRSERGRRGERREKRERRERW